MRIRDFALEDIDQIKEMHRKSGFSFELPDLSHPLMLIRKVMDDDGIRMAAFGRLHINALLFVDKTWRTPPERLDAVAELQREMMSAAATCGLDIATTQAEGRFSERLSEMGWVRGWGEMFYRQIQ